MVESFVHEHEIHPEDSSIEIDVYAPKWYRRGQGYKDLYSQKIIVSKNNDEFTYFKPYIEKTIEKLLEQNKISNIDLLVIIPKSDGTISPTLDKIGRWISDRLGGSFDTIIRKKPSPRKNQRAGSFSARYQRAKDEFSLYRDLKNNEKTILILDDQKTSGSTMLVCTKLLKDRGCLNVYCLCLGINRNIEVFGE